MLAMNAVHRFYKSLPETIEVPPEMVGQKVEVIFHLLDSNKSWEAWLAEYGIKPEEEDLWHEIKPVSSAESEAK
ncbi:MAG: hypothetical protein ACKVZH_06945 [Blastocatellia bacterium]